MRYIWAIRKPRSPFAAAAEAKGREFGAQAGVCTQPQGFDSPPVQYVFYSRLADKSSRHVIGKGSEVEVMNGAVKVAGSET